MFSILAIRCKGTDLEEILFTRVYRISNMQWSVAILNLANCLGEIPQLLLEQVTKRNQEDHDREEFTND